LPILRSEDEQRGRRDNLDTDVSRMPLLNERIEVKELTLRQRLKLERDGYL
jgi:hypothetical protein